MATNIAAMDARRCAALDEEKEFHQALRGLTGEDFDRMCGAVRAEDKRRRKAVQVQRPKPLQSRSHLRRAPRTAQPTLIASVGQRTAKLAPPTRSANNSTPFAATATKTWTTRCSNRTPTKTSTWEPLVIA